VHGEDSGKLGPAEDIQTLKNQVRKLKYLSILSTSLNLNAVGIV
jgi:hypothetical protein